MVKFAKSGLISAGVMLLALPAFCQSTDVTLYGGEKPVDSGITLSSWGSGVVEQSTEYVFSGIGSLKVTTHGRYQGARLVFGKKIDLKTALSSPGSFLKFVYFMGEKTGGSEGAPGGKGSGGFSPGGSSSGGSGKGGSGSGADGGSVRSSKVKAPTYFRVVLGTDDGKKTEFNLDLQTGRAERETWRQIAIPLSSIAGLKDSSGKLTELQFFADQSSTVYLGEVRLLTDGTPISVSDLNDATIASNDILTLAGAAEGGPTALRYVWTIQGIPSADPMEGSTLTTSYLVTGEGKNFKHQFRKKGDYQITLTVEDVYGQKKSATSMMKVHVTL